MRIVAVAEGRRQDVYCLSTPSGAFALANGAVVSNCDGAGYFCAYKFPVQRPAAVKTGPWVAGMV